MDWIEALYEKINNRLKRMSLKSAMVIYVLFVFLFVAVVYFLTILVCENWIDMLRRLYFADESYDWEKRPFLYIQHAMSAVEKANNQICFFSMVERYSLIVYTVIGVCISTHFYYKEKLKEPLHLLHEEAVHISQNDLGFSCRYDSNDEMGEVCRMFENMRLRMVENQEAIWKMIEEQRQLNAAFAHDLRTPLTVMRGYIDMVERYYPQGVIHEEKMMEILRMLGKQVERLEKFSDTMKELHGVEEWSIKKKRNDLQTVCMRIKENVQGFQKEGVEISVDFPAMKGPFFCYFDEDVILEVFDNLMGNACRFAETKIEIKEEMSEDGFSVFIRDDGCGFTERDLEQAVSPYYSGEKKEGGHFGLGLTIAKKLCEKHGGNLRIANSIEGGAIVCAEFCVKK